MKKDEIAYSIKKFKDALETLSHGVAQATDELDKDGVIQRFEFTFELLWKCVKVMLEDQGIQAKTPKECLKAAFRVGLIENEEAFLDMLEDRNRTSHIYSRDQSEKIFQRIREAHLAGMKLLLLAIETRG